MSQISITAALSAAALLIALAYQAGKLIPNVSQASTDEAPLTYDEYLEQMSNAPVDEDSDGIPDWQEQPYALSAPISPQSTTTSASSSDAVSMAGQSMGDLLVSGYVFLKGNNAYTDETASRLASAVADAGYVPPPSAVHTRSELTLVSDTSLSRVLEYRGDMRTALGMLITSDEPEIITFGRFIETGDADELDKIAESAARYREAEAKALKVTVPEDAAYEHLRAVNALASYASALEQLIQHSDDALGTLLLLRTYNESERELFSAFNALSAYYVRKTGN